MKMELSDRPFFYVVLLILIIVLFVLGAIGVAWLAHEIVKTTFYCVNSVCYLKG